MRFCQDIKNTGIMPPSFKIVYKRINYKDYKYFRVYIGGDNE